MLKTVVVSHRAVVGVMFCMFNLIKQRSPQHKR